MRLCQSKSTRAELVQRLTQADVGLGLHCELARVNQFDATALQRERAPLGRWQHDVKLTIGVRESELGKRVPYRSGQCSFGATRFDLLLQRSFTRYVTFHRTT